MRNALRLGTTAPLSLPLLLLCCGSPQGTSDQAALPATDEQTVPVSAPLSVPGTVYDYAASVPLPSEKPQEFPGLHNVFFLGDNIVSGSEPHGQEALQTLHEMGIRTILSVDGSEPHAAEASALGMRYVHIPIQYKGVTPDEKLRIAKTFRELEGPFYVHCFHGKHRGPAAAAIGRVVLDGMPRETAVAEMRQYCGTAKSYEGLYASVALENLPDARATAAYVYGFDPVHRPKGLVGVMVQVSRAHDHVEELMGRDWQADPEHPDVDPLNEAKKLVGAFRGSLALAEVVAGQDDMRGWLQSSVADSEKLVAALERAKTDPAGGADAKAAFKALKATCTACHDVYRN